MAEGATEGQPGRHFLYYFPTMLIGIFLGMPLIFSFIPAPDWLIRWILQVWAIPAVVDEFLLSRGFLPGTEELYLGSVFPPTALGWFVGTFVILAGTIFSNYLLIKIVRIVLRPKGRHQEKPEIK
jgi:hypothetical protein